MVREIKFRAWDKAGMKMFRPERLILNNPGVASVEDEIGIQVNPKSNDYVVMQFTGLLDKNKKEIFEGDILNTDEENYEVRFEHGGFWMNGYDNEYGWPEASELEIIGNKFENPELLKQT